VQLLEFTRFSVSWLQTKQTDLGRESACKLLNSTSTIAIYYYYHSARVDLSCSNLCSGYRDKHYCCHSQTNEVYIETVRCNVSHQLHASLQVATKNETDHCVSARFNHSSNPLNVTVKGRVKLSRIVHLHTLAELRFTTDEEQRDWLLMIVYCTWTSLSQARKEFHRQLLSTVTWPMTRYSRRRQTSPQCWFPRCRHLTNWTKHMRDLFDSRPFALLGDNMT